jgi:urea transport system permease protein
VRFTGFSVARYKVFIFAVAAFLAALGGILYVPQTGIITPGRMDVKASLEMIVWVAVGGRGTLGGPILGAIGVSFAYTWLTSKFPGTWLYFLGTLFIIVVLFFPQGIMGALQKIGFKRKAAAPAQPDADVPPSGRVALAETAVAQEAR